MTVTLWSGPTTVSALASAASSSIAPLAEGGYAIAFGRFVDGQTDIAGIRFTETGAAVNVNFLASATADARELFYPQIVQLSDGRLVTSYQLRFGANDLDIYMASNAAGTYTALGTGIMAASSLNETLLDIIATPSGGFASIWLRQGTNDIQVGTFNATLVPVNSTQYETSPSDVATGGDLAVLPDGKIMMVTVTTGMDLFYPLIPTLGLYSIPSSLRYDSDPHREVVLMANGDLFTTSITADGVYWQVFQRDGVERYNRDGVNGTIRDYAVTALDDGDVLLAYSAPSATDANDLTVTFQRINSVGTAIGERFVFDAPGAQFIEDLQTLNDGRVVASIRNTGNGVGSLQTLILDPRDNTLTYGSRNDVVMARLEDTLINAGNGNDRVTGMGGDDELNGQSGDDTLKGGAGDDVLKGGSGTDSLDGGSGADQLFGGSGSDLVTGGSGRDVLWGQSGNDVFRYLLASESGTTTATQDIIRDFIQTEDKIDLAGIDAKLGVAGNEAFVFIGGAAFSAEGQVRAVTVGGFTRVEMNTTGASGLEGAILVEGVIAFTSSDFIL